jgi:glutamate/aspartate transport system substrate-binding protein
MCRAIRWFGLLAVLTIPLVSAAAQDSDALSGTLKKIKDSRVITLGYRESALPFSYLGPGNRPIGYSLDLCRAIVDEIRDELDIGRLDVSLVPLKSEERLPAVVDGKVDLECGSTTDTRDREKLVAFSPVMYVTGTKLMVRRDSGIRSYRDLKARTVAAAEGTTNADAIRKISDKQNLGIHLATSRDLGDAFVFFASGKADALASDEVLLMGLRAKAKNPREYLIVGDYLTYEPYGIAFRRDDPQLAAVVDRTFRKLAEGRELTWIYDQWFRRKLPSGEQLNLDMTPQLATIFQGLGLPE